MSFEQLPYELILEIQSFLCSNKETTTLKNVCKWFWETSKQWGYLKSITISGFFIDRDLYNMCHVHRLSLEYIKFEHVFEPILYFPVQWCRNMTFSYCVLNEKTVIPMKYSPQVESLTIRQTVGYSKDSLTRIDWSRLPNLKTLVIEAFDLDFTGMEKCTLLEVIHIKLRKKKLLPVLVGRFRTLRSIKTNCVADESIHFVSKDLTLCLTPKRVSFTSDSIFVPARHLGLEYHYNTMY